MFVKMKRNKIRSGKPAKRTDIFNIKSGNLFAMDVTSSTSTEYLPPISHHRRGDTNAYYEEMKPLLYLIRIFGLLPHNMTSEGEMQFKFMSATMLYSIIVVTLTISAALVMLRHSCQTIYSLNESSFEPYTTQMAFSVGYAYLIVLPCTCIAEFRKIIRFINQWGYLQADFTEVTRKPLVLRLRWKVYVILGIMFLCSIFVGVCLEFTSLGLSWWQNVITLLCYCLAWLMAWMFLLTCAALSATAKGIGDEMAQYIATHGVDRIHKIIQYRFLWLRLSNLTHDFGNSTGFTYGSFVVMCFSVQVLSCYGSLLGINKEVRLIHILLTSSSLSFALILFCICTAAQNATQEVGAKFQGRLYALIRQYPPSNILTSNETQFFLFTISSNPPEINLNGFVVLNRGVNTALISQMVTYLVVLMQFQLSAVDIKALLNNTSSPHY